MQRFLSFFLPFFSMPRRFSLLAQESSIHTEYNNAEFPLFHPIASALFALLPTSYFSHGCYPLTRDVAHPLTLFDTR